MEDFEAFMENDICEAFAGAISLKLPLDQFIQQAELIVGSDWKELAPELLEDYPEELAIFQSLYLK
jgi:hypothetical protein